VIPQLNDTVMFIRDIIINDSHGKVDIIKIGERGRIVEVKRGFNRQDEYTAHLFRKNEKVCLNAVPSEMLVLEDDNKEEKVILT